VSYRDIDTSKAADTNSIRQIKVPMLMVYDPGDNIRGKGALIKRETLVAQIKPMRLRLPALIYWSFPR
jgi:hypothetical protein